VKLRKRAECGTFSAVARSKKAEIERQEDGNSNNRYEYDVK
jgi:hypothetical protein